MEKGMRLSRPNSDGTPVFYNASDTALELETARVLEKAWGCEVKQFAPLSPVDFYAVKHNRVVGVMELKTRSCSTETFPEVYLSLRKWSSLLLHRLGMGVPALFVVRFTDALKWIDVNEVDATKTVIGGNKRGVGYSDIEPMILVPVASMKELKGGAI